MKALLVCLLSLFLPTTLLASAATDITQDELINRQQQSDNSFILLDVRTQAEFAQGHIEGALNISHDQIEAHLEKLPKTKDLIIYCRSGKRAGNAAGVLAKNGYTRLFHLDGDMNGWMKNKRPVITE